MRFFITLLTITALSICSYGEDTAQTEKEVKITSEKEIKTSVNCQIERYTIYSPSMKRDIRIAVVLPPQYETEADKKFPVVYCLHGYGAPYDTYANMSRLHKAINDMPFIYTCFDGDKSSYLDAPEKPEFQYQTFFFKEFIPFIEQTYRANGQRGVTGFSMGGSGTTLYTLMHPEMFVASCGLSSAFLTYDPENSKRGEWYEGMIGSYSDFPERYEAIDAYKMLEKHVENGVKLPALRYCCGTEDFLLKDNRKFRDFLVEMNAKIREKAAGEVDQNLEGRQLRKAIDAAVAGKTIDFHYVEQPGSHNWAYWHGQAPEFARFFWNEFQKDAAKK